MPPKGGKETPVDKGLIAAVRGIPAAVSKAVKTTIRNAASAWMAPLDPLPPIAQEAQGRRYDYRVGLNVNRTPKLDSGISFDQLIALSESCDIVRLLIEERKDQLEAIKWDIRQRDNGPGKKKGVDNDPRIELIKAFYRKPDGRTDWKSWLRQIIEEMLVTDAVSIYRRKSKGGAPYAMELIDGATISVKIDDTGRIPLAPDPAYQQVLKGVQAVDYTADELLYYPRNLRVRHLYGYSPVEQMIVTINIALRRTAHQLAYYTDGNVPDALIGTPKEWTTKQVEEFQNYWDSLYQGDNVGVRRKGVFVPGDAKNIHEIIQPPLKDMYDEWIARIACFCFKVSSQPFVQQVNRATAQTSHETAQESGLITTKDFVKSLMDKMLEEDFKSPDLEFVWLEEEEQNQLEQQQILTGYSDKAILTKNEVRLKLGEEPDPGPNASRLGFTTATGFVPLDENEEEKAMRLAGAGLDKNGKPLPKEEPPEGDEPAAGDKKNPVEKLEKKKNRPSAWRGTL